jgi:hypothetical protein
MVTVAMEPTGALRIKEEMTKEDTGLNHVLPYV